MNPTLEFIRRLEDLKDGERSRLRRLAGQPLDQTLQGFDLFTGLWWPLRAENERTPRRETSWLVAKLYGSFLLPHSQGQSFARLLGRLEPRDEHGERRFRSRFDAILCSPLPGIEPRLRWALDFIADAVVAKKATGLDWAQLLDDLSIWDRADEHRRHRDIRDIWAEQYLQAAEHRTTSRDREGAVPHAAQATAEPLADARGSS